jgi:hypothetical protein
MKRVICIDSNIFIWGIRGVSAPGQEDMIKRAKNFISWVESKNLNILLPAPMMAEVLSPVPVNNHTQILSLLGSRFLVTPFDAPAASKCAELLYKSFTQPDLIKYRLDNAVPKQKMKYDCMIVATCIVKRVDCLYSNDADLKKFADNQIDVQPLPDLKEIGKQVSLFSQTDDAPF